MHDTAEDYQRELDRVCDRLRGMPLSRLAVAAELAYETSVRLAAVLGHAAPVPRLADHAAADQVAVLGRDVLAYGDADQLRTAEQELAALRRSLP